LATKLASLLVVSLGNAFNGIPRSLNGLNRYQMALCKFDLKTRMFQIIHSVVYHDMIPKGNEKTTVQRVN